VNRLPRWRIAAAIFILGGLAFFGAIFTPIYFHNLQLQNYVAGLTEQPGAQNQSEDALRAQVLEKARALDLPITPDNIKIYRSAEKLRIEVRYFVRVTLPGYTVDLHFYPGAGSK
jgi:hypothetical protein